MMEVCLEKMEANPEEIESAAKHQEEEFAVEDPYWDRHLDTGLHRQPKKWTQGNGGSWEKFGRRPQMNDPTCCSCMA
jgi:hypothetical protein